VRGSGTILLVEDEDGLRAITRQVLEACGYRVLEARDGGEACLLALAEPVVDLLLADTVLPHTDTGEMVRRILARHPAAAVLFVSGYAGDPMERVGVRPPGATFLPKPFGAPDLSRRVRHALVARSGAESGRRTA
jgi:DNA-binding response OmpR family regulator